MPTPCRTRSAPLLLASLLLSACTDTPSPLANAGAVDHVELRYLRTAHRAWTPAIVSRDSALIAGLLEVAKAPGEWKTTWHTEPAGEREVGLFNGQELVGSLHFSPGFLLVKSPTKAELRKIDSTTWRRLAELVTWWPPRFEDYATTDTLLRKLSALDYETDPDTRRFRSHLEAARKQPANFDGHYEFVVWGCGTQCTSHLLLDLRTGRAYNDTLVDFSCGTVDYRRTSGLVITGPDRTGAMGERCGTRPVRYFAWTGKQLEELLPEPRDPM